MPVVPGAVSVLVVSAGTGTVELTGGSVTVDGEAAVVYLTPGVGNPVTGALPTTGDMFANPVILLEAGATISVNLSTTTLETGEPTAGDATHTVWLKFNPTVAGKLTIHGDEIAFSYTIEYFSGTTLDDLVLIQEASYIDGTSVDEVELVQDVAAVGPHYFRVRPYDLAAGTDSNVSLTYSFDERLPDLVVDVNTPTLQRTPANLLASVLNAEPGEVVEFELVGYGVLTSEVADDSGVVGFASVPLPTLPAGTHTLRTTGVTSGRADLDSIQVLFGPNPTNTSLGFDTPVVPVAQVGVRKWVIQDPAPGGETYIFPYNPTTMSPPHAPRFITPETTTAPDGITHMWEGAPRAHSWNFSGFCDTQAFYEKLQEFTAMQHRLYLIDHRNRAWVVSLESFDPTPKRDRVNVWSFTYEIQALIYAGPTQLEDP